MILIKTVNQLKGLINNSDSEAIDITLILNHGGKSSKVIYKQSDISWRIHHNIDGTEEPIKGQDGFDKCMWLINAMEKNALVFNFDI